MDGPIERGASSKPCWPATTWPSLPRSSGGPRHGATSTPALTQPRWPLPIATEGRPAWFGAHQRSHVRRQRRRPGRGIPILWTARSPQRLHHHRRRRTRVPRDGGRCAAADRGRPHRYPTGRASRAGLVAEHGRAHRSEVGKRTRRRPQRPEPTSSGSTSGRSRKARRSPWTISGPSA